MKTLCVYEGPDHFHALSARELLESNGIVTLFPDEYSSLTRSGLFLSPSYRILVDESDFKQSVEILKAMGFIDSDEVSLDQADLPSPDNNHCPVCGSPDIKAQVKRRTLFSVLSFLFIGKNKTAAVTKYICRKCRNTWISAPPEADS